MAIQNRRGKWSDFDPAKLLPGEGAYILEGDPNSTDGQSVYFCFNAGDVKRMATYEDMVQNIQNATSQIQAEFTQELTQTLSEAQTALSEMETATEEATEATGQANTAAEAANQAAATASGVVEDIGTTPITFTQAVERTNLISGDTVKSAFGKIMKWFVDLKDSAFNSVANNLITIEAGSVLDARQGKILDDSKLNTNGDASSTTANFTQASTRTNISTGETLVTIFGKVSKWFADLKTAAFQSVANVLTTTTAGSVLDARQGKTLSDTINGIRTDLGDPDNLNTSAKSNVVAAVNELNSNIGEAAFLGKLSYTNYVYNSDEIMSAITAAYNAIPNQSIFSGLLLAKVASNGSSNWWRIDGLKSSDAYGYLMISTYTTNGVLRHESVLSAGDWTWFN